MNTRGYDVFISYRREYDAALAQLVRKALLDRGLKVFLDVRELGAGPFDTTLLQRIKEAPDFVVILSPKSLDRCLNKDDWLAKEIAHALQTDRNIVPLVTQDFTFPDTLPESLASLPRYERARYDHHFSDASIGRLYHMLRSRRRRLLRHLGKMVVLLSALLLICIIGVTTWSSRHGSQLTNSVSGSVAAEERTLSYSLVVQKYRDDRPFQEPFPLASEINFESDYRIRLVVTSPQPGYLYILNEGPVADNGMPAFNVLFPSSTANGGSAWLAATQQVRIPEHTWLSFDEEAGTEKLWMVWSDRSVPELEAVKGLANPEDKGVVSRPEQITAIRVFLTAHSGTVPQIRKDEVRKQTSVTVRAATLVHVVNLEHH